MEKYRIFVEKHPEFQVEARSLKDELCENLQLELRTLRLLNVYDLDGFTPELLEKCRYSVFGETVTDAVTDSIDLAGTRHIAVEFLPGQFDQRAASAVDCVHLIDPTRSANTISIRWRPARRTLPSFLSPTRPPSSRYPCWKASAR